MTATERGDWLDHAAACETCRAIANTLPVDGPGVAPTTIGRFVPTREIGRGAMGVVYAADDPELGRPIALKLLHDATDGDRLHREARALAKLAHDNVVRVYDVGVDEGRVWVAMELVDGVTLRSWLAEPRALDTVLATLLLAGRGLAAAHAAGIVHRDFKPDNVLIGTGRVVVGDFGLSRFGAREHAPADQLLDVANAELTRTGAVVGTPAYMAPEQIAGDATPASDQFGFCVTAWEAMFGVRPFHGATLRELRASILEGYFTRPTRAVPRRIERALRRGLAGDPAARFSSMTELLAALAPPRRRRLVVAAVLATAAVTGGVAYAVGDKPADPCETAAASILDIWDDAARSRIADHARVAFIDDYVRGWQAARLTTCRRPDATTQRAARDICFERARAELASQVASATPVPLEDLRSKLLPVATCEAALELPKTPGFEVDVRGCGCPYSACEDRVCLSECNARSFRPAGPVPGVAITGEQEAVTGASLDGETLLYVSGKDCILDHLYLARHRGDRYDSIDLTPELKRHGMRPFENCCTLAGDARSVIVATRKRASLTRFVLDGDTLVPGDPRELAGLFPNAPASYELWGPVLSADQLTLFFLVVDMKGGIVPLGPFESHRASRDQPFPLATRMTGRASLYESVSGISADGRSLFMTTEFSTSVLVRGDNAKPFGDQGIGKPPVRLPGWRAIPIDNCRRIITTMSPGGCQQEQSVFLEAVP